MLPLPNKSHDDDYHSEYCSSLTLQNRRQQSALLVKKQ